MNEFEQKRLLGEAFLESKLPQLLTLTRLSFPLPRAEQPPVALEVDVFNLFLVYCLSPFHEDRDFTLSYLPCSTVLAHSRCSININ